MTNVASFLKDESGASAAEYVLILAILGSAIAAAMVTFGGSISTALGKAGTSLTNINFNP